MTKAPPESTSHATADSPESDQQPDVEIYVRRLDVDTLEQWLLKHFEFERVEWFSSPSETQPLTLTLAREGHTFELMVTPRAAGKQYTSLWFKQNRTPWRTDKECALDYLAEQDTEVRCSAQSWHEEEAEASEEWLVLTRTDEKRVRWL